ncbi:transcription factor SPT20 homolog isoform X6 [Centrocercus urophasianus]|uniref:transcription factor SPT20 homolog isoform X6 n=1 Tax=Centrocercus urophasianus TaxID=9002 RepID=UPI001C64DBA2|nr:transcription factor SPT20 homolog isoform X6 [Centrocercus urophasianus]XP_042724203.1 transcription factor SPT20 homolog isoform X5 [Lagopus leucura]XP_048804429.1 transcription factor SPT20 homolog isoform X11 [Lagopus muta]
MQQALEQALDRAEYIIESARQRPPKRKYLSSGRKSVFQKLYDLYIEECEKEPEIKQKLRRNVNLLEKLVMQETLSCLVVNLYPGNEGYSLMLRGKNGSDSETIRLPYEEGELLEYLDAEELPPILVDLLEKSQVNIFHCGCVIAEIRDYRQSGNMKSPTYQSKHILLRPTMQTLICDVHSITSDNHKWTQEDKLLLESQLILATAEPLCLDPSIAVTCTTNRLLYNKQKMNTRPMKRCFKRYSKSSLNRQQEVAHYSTPPQLRLVDYLQKKKEKKGTQQYDLKISKAGNCVDMWKQNPCYLTAPSEVDVEKYAKVESSIKPDDSQPTVWPAHEVKDDYVFECEVGNQLQKTKLTIFQSLGNPLYYGKIQTLKGDDESDSLLVPPQFLIGSKTDAERVVNQYHELVKSEAKCPVKMFHNSGGSINLSHLSPGKEMEQPESISGSVQSSVLGKGVKHRPPPIKLPSSSGSSSSGNIFSPQQSSGHLKSPTPPPPPPSSKPPGLSRKQSMDLNQVSMLSPAAMSPASSSQRTASTQVMANPAGLNFINVVGSVCGAQTLMSGSNPMLGCNTGAIAPAGINLSGILPSGGLVPSALPAAMQSASQAGSPFGLKNASNLRPLNLLQGSDQGPSNQDQALSAQQAAVINLTGVGNFMQPQATAVAILAASNGYGSSSSTSSSSTTSAAFRQPLKK